MLTRLLLLLLTCQIAFSMRLIDQLANAHPEESYLFQAGSQATLLRVKSLSKHEIEYEEIHAPLCAKEIKALDIETWLMKGAPGHTAWIVAKLDAKTGEMKQARCKRRGAEISTNDYAFTTTLFGLTFEPTPLEEQRRCGVASDNLLPRRLWKPPLAKGLFDEAPTPYVARWPKDGSPLSGGRIEIYLHKKVALPIWIEGKRGNLKERVHLVQFSKSQ
jgi:hypothetical protein